MKILLLLLAMFITGNANAMEGGFGQTITSIDEPIEHEVTVGEVDASLGTYDIEITWDSFVFDYVYDEETDSYKWVTNIDGSSETSLSIYNNNHINYPIVPTITWTSAENYDFVKGVIKEEAYICYETEYDEEKFNSGEIFNGTGCIEHNWTYPGLTFEADKYYEPRGGFVEIYENKPVGGNPSGESGKYSYLLFISLENDSTKEAKTPTAGDTIGTFTITFEDAEANDQ